ncbi:MAG: HAMP domain-containing histidine kinase [Acidobacteriia bacterium]|nr:HAMP domain-containing histidine kinase [Terriglobia bacterium]
MSRSQSHALRAGALLRMGRVLRKLKKFSQASSAYASLIALGNEPVAGAPAALVGRHALASLKDEAGDKEGARQQARLLREDLVTGAWTIDRATYEFHRSSVQDWLGVEALFNVEEEILAAAIEQAWKRRSEAIKGSASLWLEGRPVVLAWDRNGAVAAGPKWLAARCQEWRTRQQQVDFSVIDAGGHLACGSPGGGQPWAIRAASETKLPWAVRVHGSQFAQNQWDTRRRLLLAGLALMVLVTLGGGYATQRAARREFAVARLKSDFVAAVSHEFRSPLTAMRHMVELLEEGTVFSEEKRRRYYSVLGKETDRLHRLVESLLNFGRMEAGQQHYQLSPQDAGELVYQTVRDFQGGLRGAGSLTVETSGVLMVRADAEALRCALWNLLDNAVKYSPFVAPLEAKVEVSVQRQHGKVGIIVKDHGAGIAPAEQKEIFGKFVRGSGAQASGVKGTGIGLAMVEHIIRAHGGEIRLQSELGLGSVFTILLPAYEEPV